MADEQNNGGFEREMYPVNEKCADCGTEITQLPFKPDPARSQNLRCRDCYRNKRDTFQKDR
ncbi:MAG: hypothetical protein WAP23_02860 [Candidatus Spechtbacterales bacterium]